MRKVLSVEKPTIETYPSLTSCFSVIESKKNTVNWKINNFIQLVAVEKEHGAGCNFLDNFIIGSGINALMCCPYINTNVIDGEIIYVNWSNIVDFIKYCIVNDYYLSITLNGYYIPSSHSFQKNEDYHQTFIYGYDDEKEIIFIADFYFGKFTFTELSFENANKAVGLSSDFKREFWINNIYIFRFKENLPDISINFNRIKGQIEDYLNSSDSTMRLTNDYDTTNQNYFYGVSYYDFMKGLMQKDYCNYLFPHILYTQKLLMKDRILYFVENHFLDKNSDYLGLADELCNIALNNRNMYIKCKMNKCKEQISALCDKYENMKQKDIRLCQILYDFFT